MVTCVYSSSNYIKFGYAMCIVVQFCHSCVRVKTCSVSLPLIMLLNKSFASTLEIF